jgi:uncharacterized protein (TIGR03086 family)
MLRTVTEEFASYLSEVTDGDLRFPTPCTGWTMGDLCQHAVEENGKFGHAVSGLPVPRDATAEYWSGGELKGSRMLGGGFEVVYRASARYMESAFGRVDDPAQARQLAGVPGLRPVAEILEMQVADTLIHTWDLARSLGFPYSPREDIAELALRRMRALPAVARGKGKAFAEVRTSPDASQLTVLDQLLLYSGRDILWVSKANMQQNKGRCRRR